MIEKEKGQLNSRPLIMQSKDTKKQQNIKSFAVTQFEKIVDKDAKCTFSLNLLNRISSNFPLVNSALVISIFQHQNYREGKL